MPLPFGRALFSTLGVAAVLTVATAGTATAETLSVTDQARDVQSFTMDSDTATNEPGVANGDILRTVLRHNSGQISARVKLAELRRVGEVRGDFMRVLTNEGITRDVSIYAGPNMWRGEAEMSRPNGKTVTCDISHKIDYDRNVVTVSFPRSCVSSPRWVRIGLGSSWANSGFAKFYLDDSQISGHVNPDRLRLSPRLSRG